MQYKQIQNSGMSKHYTEKKDRVVYNDASYKDKTKIAGGRRLAEEEKICRQRNEKFTLPTSVNMCRANMLSDCVLINRDGKEHDFIPDGRGRHVLLVHKDVAKVLVSGVCMLVRITQSEDGKGNTLDGSWAIVPAEYKMMNATTIQHVRKRKFWFLYRHHYEISFDGRVQPAHMLYDYGLNPLQKKTRFYITREYVPVRNVGKDNDYFRFWKEKPGK